MRPGDERAASKKVAEDFRLAHQDVRAMRKAHARERAEQLRKEMRLLEKLLAGNPKELARQIARIAKELRAVLKEFGDAHKGDVADATARREAAQARASSETESAQAGTRPQPAPAPERTLEQRRREAGLEETPEALEMKDFIRDLRGMVKKLRELLQEAKIKSGAAAREAKPAHEKRDPFEIAKDELAELEKALNEAYQDASAEAKVFDAPGSLVSLQA